MTDISLDLETWGKRAGFDIRSIGATVFNPRTGAIGIPCTTCKGGTTRGNVNDGGDCSDCMNERVEHGCDFYVATDNPVTAPKVPTFWDGVSEYRKYKLKRDPNTVKWWSEQTPESQAAFANPVDLKEACIHFAEWLDNMHGGADPQELKIWANDPHFDIAILEGVFYAVGVPVPWHYRSPRSMKTVTDLAGLTRDEYANYGVAHHALHDAIAQAMTISTAVQRLTFPSVEHLSRMSANLGSYTVGMLTIAKT